MLGMIVSVLWFLLRPANPLVLLALRRLAGSCSHGNIFRNTPLSSSFSIDPFSLCTEYTFPILLRPTFRAALYM